MPVKSLGINVYDAAQQRISFVFDNFEKIYISFSGGKDSTVMTHLVMEEAIKRGVKVGLFFLDWECQFKITIEHVKKIYQQYSNNIVPMWVALPIKTWNGCSQIEPEWVCWDKSKKQLWVREQDPLSITDEGFFPFYKKEMMFEEFTPELSKWFSDGKPCANFIGIRTMESLNRYRSLVVTQKDTYRGNRWTTRVFGECWNAYPIYDWDVKDIWTYCGKYKKQYNTLYDRMYQAGISISQMRIDEPFGDTQRVGLGLYQIVEPETWAKMCARVSGANLGSLYASEKGNVLGNRSITLPEGHTWQSFANFLLYTMPSKTSNHYKNKITVYLHWYIKHGYPEGIPDCLEGDLGSHDIPSWRRICKTLLRNDYWCKGLNFSPTKTHAYDKYLTLMEKRKVSWKISLQK
jgi:predicted phosphoadenosine phosphosulfate sulfurtransferase